MADTVERTVIAALRLPALIPRFRARQRFGADADDHNQAAITHLLRRCYRLCAKTRCEDLTCRLRYLSVLNRCSMQGKGLLSGMCVATPARNAQLMSHNAITIRYQPDQLLFCHSFMSVGSDGIPNPRPAICRRGYRQRTRRDLSAAAAVSSGCPAAARQQTVPAKLDDRGVVGKRTSWLPRSCAACLHEPTTTLAGRLRRTAG